MKIYDEDKVILEKNGLIYKESKKPFKIRIIFLILIIGAVLSWVGYFLNIDLDFEITWIILFTAGYNLYKSDQKEKVLENLIKINELEVINKPES